MALGEVAAERYREVAARGDHGLLLDQATQGEHVAEEPGRAQERGHLSQRARREDDGVPPGDASVKETPGVCSSVIGTSQQTQQRQESRE